jgi:hypothetical protein
MIGITRHPTIILPKFFIYTSNNFHLLCHLVYVTAQRPGASATRPTVQDWVHYTYSAAKALTNEDPEPKACPRVARHFRFLEVPCLRNLSSSALFRRGRRAKAPGPHGGAGAGCPRVVLSGVGYNRWLGVIPFCSYLFNNYFLTT